VQIGDTSSTQFEATGLTTGQTYNFKLQAVNAIGISDMSPESDDIIAAIVPDQPG
jgi:hypothetical protein